MRQQLRVFVHELPPGLVSNMTRRTGGDRAYMMELVFFQRLLSSPLRTRTPEYASLFVVPIFPTSCRFSYTRADSDARSIKRRHTIAECAAEMATGLAHLAASSPYFRKRGTSDHL